MLKNMLYAVCKKNFTMVPHVVPFNPKAEFAMGRDEKCIALYNKMVRTQANISFNDLCKLAAFVGFTFSRQSSSHHIYKHEKYPGIMNFQDRKGKAKPFQVRQLIEFIDEHNLLPKEDL